MMNKEAQEYVDAFNEAVSKKAETCRDLMQRFLSAMEKGELIRVMKPPEGYRWKVTHDGDELIRVADKKICKVSDVVFEKLYTSEED